MNCLIVDDDRVCRTVLEKYIDRTKLFEKYFSLESAVGALKLLQEGKTKIDILFLDIEMPEMNGMELLSVMDNSPQVIIVSSREKYALTAFEYDVTDYLLKPVTFPRFIRSVNRGIANIHKDTKAKMEEQEDIFSDDKWGKKTLWIKNNSKLDPVNPEDIIYIESLENYAQFVTFGEKYITHYPLKLIDEKLPENLFIRIHRSYIVNIRKIKRILGNTLEVETEDGTHSLPFSKSHRELLINQLHVLGQ
jgi:DNA-binding LytR/AlgR family response regulator